MVIKVFSAFSGYGGAEYSLQKANIDFEVVGYSEIWKNAIKCYEQNHPGIKNFDDITKINPDDIEDFDLFTGGFVCSSFSASGKNLGEDDPRGVGKLFYEIIRICEVKKPKYMFLENVAGLTYVTHEQTFKRILSMLDRIGYVVKYKLMTSSNYGTPQSRERIYFVCYRKDLKIESNPFPKEQELKIKVKDILEKEVDSKYYLTEKQVDAIKKRERFGDHLYEGICDIHPTLCAIGKSDVAVILDNTRTNCEKFAREYENISPTLTCMTTKSLLLKSTYRHLTPRECFRLQGFFHDEINLDNLSDSALYKLAGNGWDINTVSQIFDRMFNCKDDNGVIHETYGWVRKTKGYF